ncbi:hypothetical protein J2W43_004241 [Pseudomonas brassicacearum]|uniref:Lipoprotein n=1 Tax=Pseudomonas brassicacearum TaxID=930166 RepID=A0AAW8MDT0_9PSED|nr:hypothetical protein [Pseudomonas brassicacearum]MDR6960241.1 hypothetical protein [Pseudomonas brassicacearum]
MIKAHCAIWMGCLLTSLTACAQQQSPSVTPSSTAEQVVTMGGQTLMLENDQARCVLRKPDQTLMPLDLAWPCQFTVDRQGNPHVETFGKVPIVIVVHVAADPHDSQACRSEYRAIRQINGQLEPSVIARNASCMRGTGDQKNYTGLFTW